MNKQIERKVNKAWRRLVSANVKGTDDKTLQRLDYQYCILLLQKQRIVN